VNWIDLAQDRDKLSALVKKMMNIRVTSKAENLSCRISLTGQCMLFEFMFQKLDRFSYIKFQFLLLYVFRQRMI
jgi:hypothetical protein